MRVWPALLAVLALAACKAPGGAQTTSTEAAKNRCGGLVVLDVAVDDPRGDTDVAWVEAEVLAPLETLLQPLEGVVAVHGFARAGHARVVVESAEPSTARLARMIRQRLTDDALPAGSAAPVLTEQPGQERFFSVILHGPGPRQLREWSRRLAEALHADAHVGRVDIVGVLLPELRVIVDPDRMIALDLDAAGVADALRAALPSPTNIRRGEPPLQVRELVIAEREGQPVRVGDIARIEQEIAGLPAIHVDGQRAVVLVVRGAAGTAEEAVETRLRQMLGRITWADGVARLAGPVSVSRCDDVVLPRVTGPLAVVRDDGGALARPTDLPGAFGGEAPPAGPAAMPVAMVEGCDLFFGPAQARGLELASYAEDQATALAQARRWKDEMAAHPGMRPVVIAPAPARVILELAHADLENLYAATRALRDALDGRDGVLSVATIAADLEPSLRVTALPAAAQLGLDEADVLRAVQVRRHGEAVGVARGLRDQVPVYLHIGAPPARASHAADSQLDPAQLQSMLLRTSTGEPVPLSQVAELRLDEAPREIYRRNGQRRTAVVLTLAAEGAHGPLIEALERDVLGDFERQHRGLDIEIR